MKTPKIGDIVYWVDESGICPAVILIVRDKQFIRIHVFKNKPITLDAKYSAVYNYNHWSWPEDAEEKPKECVHEYEDILVKNPNIFKARCKKCWHIKEVNKAEELIEKIDNVLEGTRTNMCDKLYHIINLIQEYKQEKVNQYK